MEYVAFWILVHENIKFFHHFRALPLPTSAAQHHRFHVRIRVQIQRGLGGWRCQKYTFFGIDTGELCWRLLPGFVAGRVLAGSFLSSQGRRCGWFTNGKRAERCVLGAFGWCLRSVDRERALSVRCTVHYEERWGEKEVCVDGIMQLHIISFLNLTSFGRHPSIRISFAPLFDHKDYNRDLNSDRPVGISRSRPSLDLIFRTVTGLVTERLQQPSSGYGKAWHLADPVADVPWRHMDERKIDNKRIRHAAPPHGFTAASISHGTARNTSSIFHTQRTESTSNYA